MSKYWQVAAGSDGRNYFEYFLRYGIAFVGGAKPIATIKRVKKDDIIILKKGMSEVLAVGIAVERDGKTFDIGDKAWLLDFDGWHLPAYCFVDWYLTQPTKTRGLTRATIEGVDQIHLKQIADDIIKSVAVRQVVNPEPVKTVKVDDETILEFLIQKGLRPANAEEVNLAFRRIRRLANYYYKTKGVEWSDIREHETRTFLIMPLLLALGWAEQQIKIELSVPGGKIDVACFSKPYCRNSKNKANDDDCVLLLESKGFSQGLDYAPKQVQGYAKHFPQCKVLVVSNGFCYKAYSRDQSGQFNKTPSAYLNILNPQDKYPLDPLNVDGCLEVLRLLMPT